MTAIAASDARPPLVLAVDLGSSSLRVMLYDSEGRLIKGTTARRTYSVRTTEDGGAELDAGETFFAFESALDEVLGKADGTGIAGVATSTLAANVLGVDSQGRAITPAFLYSDTRDAAVVQALRERVDWAPILQRTGCPLHTSYLPARFLWLQQTQADIYKGVARWVSLHEFFLLKLFGTSIISHSQASWTGLLDRVALDWDEEVLALAGVRREQLSRLASARDSMSDLLPAYRARWRALSQARFFPAIGDGAAANIGSGCATVEQLAVTIGTSGAIRVVLPATTEARTTTRPSSSGTPAVDMLNASLASFRVPHGLWLYRVDERRGLLGGSLNNGGNVFAYLERVLRLPSDLERALQLMAPDAHGLTVLPFFAGERSPGYRGEARATVAGWSLETTPLHILRACFEAIAYRFAAIYDLLRAELQPPQRVVASGAALLHSPAWVQIIADVLGLAVTVSGEEETSARGVAVLALEALGAMGEPAELQVELGITYSPDPGRYEIYLSARERQQKLYTALVTDQMSNPRAR